MAAKISVYCDGDKDDLFNELCELASYHVAGELNRSIARALGLPMSSVRMSSDTVMRSGIRQTCSYIDLVSSELTSQMACDGIQVWKSIDADRNYFRIQSANAVAIIDEEFNENIYFDKVNGDESKLNIDRRSIPDWEKRLNSLFPDTYSSSHFYT